MLLRDIIHLQKFDVPPRHQKAFLVNFIHGIQKLTDEDCAILTGSPIEQQCRLERTLQLLEASSADQKIEQQVQKRKMNTKKVTRSVTFPSLSDEVCSTSTRSKRSKPKMGDSSQSPRHKPHHFLSP